MTEDEILELYWEEFPDRGPPDAQQLHDFHSQLNPIDGDDICSKEGVEALMQENAARSSATTSSQETGLADGLMQKHGLTQKRVAELLEAFGG